MKRLTLLPKLKIAYSGKRDKVIGIGNQIQKFLANNVTKSR